MIDYNKLKILAEKDYTPEGISYPILTYKNSIIDGHKILLDNIKKNAHFTQYIELKEDDIKFAKME